MFEKNKEKEREREGKFEIKKKEEKKVVRPLLCRRRKVLIKNIGMWFCPTKGNGASFFCVSFLFKISKINLSQNSLESIGNVRDRKVKDISRVVYIKTIEDLGWSNIYWGGRSRIELEIIIDRIINDLFQYFHERKSIELSHRNARSLISFVCCAWTNLLKPEEDNIICSICIYKLLGQKYNIFKRLKGLRAITLFFGIEIW